MMLTDTEVDKWAGLERIATMPPVLWGNEQWGEMTKAVVKAVEAQYREKLKVARADYVRIEVAKHLIPEGVKLVEAYELDWGWIVYGEPPDIDDENDPRYHDCDAMGCPTLGHIVLKVRKL